MNEEEQKERKKRIEGLLKEWGKLDEGGKRDEVFKQITELYREYIIINQPKLEAKRQEKIKNELHNYVEERRLKKQE